MGRKSKVSTEVKIKACENYLNGRGSFYSIAKSIGVGYSTVNRWVCRYREHGKEAFTEKDHNNSYSKEFKLQIISEYLNGEDSSIGIAARYKITDHMVLSWVNKYNKGIEITDYNPKPEVYTMKNKKKTYDEKLDIVKYVLANDFDYKGAAIKYSIKYSSIYSWVKRYKVNGEEGLKNRKRGPRKVTVNLDEMTEVEKLKYLLKEEKKKRELAEFKVEALKKKQEIEERLYRK